ncbi:MAG: hypothetical protein Q8P98_10890, partial [Candidatus Rokubacteria bacterium]|nr:hypothetical protein [Candidatus Rokubacteria bacterium]
GGGGIITIQYTGTLTAGTITASGGSLGTGDQTGGSGGSSGTSTQTSIAPVVYVLGGLNGSTAQSTVYKSSISGSDLGTFATTDQNQLPVALKNLTANVVTISNTNYLYVLGGNTGSADVDTVYKSTIDSSGNVGAFSTTSQGQLPQVLSSHSSVIVSDGGTNYIYVLGGINGSTRQTTVYRATIDASGNIGTFATTSQTQLPVALSDSAVTSVATGSNNHIYLFGGLDSSGSPVTTVYKGTLDGSGNISSWTSTGQASLPTALSSLSAVSTTVSSVPYAYIIGGLNSSSSPVSTLYKAQINDMSNYIASKTITSTDLSNKNDITFYVNSATTGTYLTMDVNNGSGWQACDFSGSANFTISSASTWEQKDCTITGFTRTAVTGVRFRVASNQTSNFTTYFDDVNALMNAATVSNSTSALAAALGAANLTLNSQGTGLVALNYDATNSMAGSGGLIVYNGATTPLFTINSSGNVGIGTTNPLFKLDVNGTANIAGALTVTG